MFPNNREQLKGTKEIDEHHGSMKRDSSEDKMMHTVLEDDKAKAEGKLVNEAINKGVSFSSNVMFEKLVNNYHSAEELFGETFIREMTGMEAGFIKRNAKIPEFQRELKNSIMQKIDELKKKKLIDKDGSITEKGIKLAGITLCMEELDKTTPKDMFGEKTNDKKSIYGEKEDVDSYSQRYRYRDIALKRTIKTALRRGHREIASEDLKIFTRKNKGSIYVIYALDSSGSMKGLKLEVSKKAGIALAHRAVTAHDKVGLIVFSSSVEEYLLPSDDFMTIVNSITKIKAGKETNMVFAIEKAIEMFPPGDVTKHLIMITDAVPTVGDKDDIFKAVLRAKSHNITISVVGINLIDGRNVAEKIVEYGNGRLYILRTLEDMNQIVLEDYYAL